MNKIAGFYNSGITLTLNTVEPDSATYYTLDGSIPTLDSYLYTSPLIMGDLSGEPASISTIFTSSSWSPPTGEVGQINVILARSFSNGIPSSRSFSKTYMIGNEITENYDGFPIVSIQTDSLNLFDFDTGIYVQGVHYDPGSSQWTGNYFQKGIEWERDVHIEFFENGQLEWSQGVGMRIHGGKTRNAPQKSLRLYARGEKGAEKFRHRMFETKEKTVFDKFILRAHFSCWNKTMIKDALTGYIGRNLDFETQQAQPVIVFSNGEYWGIQTFREYFDADFIEEEYDADKDSVDILLHGSGTHPNYNENWGIVEGDNAHYLAMLDFIENNDLSDPFNYQYITTQLDISSMIDYYCTEIYFNNRDWPSNNHKVWRGGEDSKWRSMLYDFDSGWGYTSVATNTLLYASHPTGSTIYNTPYTTFLFRNLLLSEEFNQQFISRYACLMNTTFREDSVEMAIDRFVDAYDPGVAQHADRWHTPASHSDWSNRVYSKLYSFNANRRQYAIDHVSLQFGIDFDPDDYDCNSIVTEENEVEIAARKLMVYPNPSNSNVWVDFLYASNNAELIVVDVTGRVIVRQKYEFHRYLNVDSWQEGIYMAIIEDDNETTFKKFIVVH